MMTLNKLLSFRFLSFVFALVCLAFGILFLRFPVQMFNFFGLEEMCLSAEIACTDFGASYIGYSLLVLAFRRTNDPCLFRTGALVLAIGRLVSGGVLLHNILISTMIDNVYSWITLGLYALFMVLFLVCRYRQEKC